MNGGGQMTVTRLTRDFLASGEFMRVAQGDSVAGIAVGLKLVPVDLRPADRRLAISSPSLSKAVQTGIISASAG